MNNINYDNSNDLIAAYRKISDDFEDFTQLMRQKTGCQVPPRFVIDKSTGEVDNLYRLTNIKRAQQQLMFILKDDIFSKTSKYDDELKNKISCLNDNLWELGKLLSKAGKEEDL